jgi:hypothetical protein
LVRKETVGKGLLIGLVSSMACAPYVWQASPSSELRTLQLSFLPFVLVLLAMVTIAWGEPPRPWREQLANAARLALPAGLALGCIYMLGEERYMLEYLARRYPKEPRQVLLALPWVGLFQTLVAVTGVYAFALRLFRTKTAGLVAVVFAHQGLLLLQYRQQLPVEVLVLGVIFTGLHGLVLGWSYIAVGFAGPVVVAMVCQLRHLVRILYF